MTSRSESLSWYVESLPPSAKAPPQPPEGEHLELTLMGLLELYRRSKLKFSEKTVAEYRTTIRNLEAFLERPATVADFSDEILLGYLRHRVETRSPATGRKDRQQILSMWRWAWRKSYVEILPRDIPEIAVPRKRVRAWTLQEFAAILKACETAPIEPVRYRSSTMCDRKGDRWRWGPREWKALLLVLFDSAERIGAMIQCPKSGFDPNQMTLTVPARVRKFGQADQVSALHPETVESIKDMLVHREAKSDRLFDWQGHSITLTRRFNKIIKAAGIKPNKKRKPFHDVRRLSYTLVAARFGKAAASDHAGHSADLSRFYLDAGLLSAVGERRFADSIQRPALSEPDAKD